MKNKGYISRMVYYILKNDVASRDEWILVLKKIHDNEMILLNIKESEYYNALFSYKLTNPQTIIRIWRKIQEHNVDLRGQEWLERQKQGGIVAEAILNGQFIQSKLF